MTRKLRGVELTYPIAMAASRDAGNRHMRANGRTAWNLDDWNVAAEKAEKLRPYIVPSSSVTQRSAKP